MSDDSKAMLTVGCLILMISAGYAVPGLIQSHQRYTTYLEAQRTVLECRASLQPSQDYDRICGPIPTPGQPQ